MHHLPLLSAFLTMFHYQPPSTTHILNRKKLHQHHESKKWIRIPANEKCLKCYPVPRPFLETTLGRLPPEIRAPIFRDVLTVGTLSPLKDGISVPMVKSRSQVTGSPAGPASCLALLQTCRQIYHETSCLFYTLNTLHFSKPQDLLSFLSQLGTERWGVLKSLHLDEMTVQVPRYTRSHLESFRSRGENEDTLCDEIHEDFKEAVQLLNKRGNLRKIYLDMRPSQTLKYVLSCAELPCFRKREIKFASPTRWSMVVPSTSRRRSCIQTFLDQVRETRIQDMPFYAYWSGNEKYRVELDIFPVLSEPQSGDTASTRSGQYVGDETANDSIDWYSD